MEEKKNRKSEQQGGKFPILYILFWITDAKGRFCVCFEGMSRRNEAGKFICQANEKQECDDSYRFSFYNIIHTTNFWLQDIEMTAWQQHKVHRIILKNNLTFDNILNADSIKI